MCSSLRRVERLEADAADALDTAKAAAVDLQRSKEEVEGKEEEAAEGRSAVKKLTTDIEGHVSKIDALEKRWRGGQIELAAVMDGATALNKEKEIAEGEVRRLELLSQRNSADALSWHEQHDRVAAQLATLREENEEAVRVAKRKLIRIKVLIR